MKIVNLMNAIDFKIAFNKRFERSDFQKYSIFNLQYSIFIGSGLSGFGCLKKELSTKKEERKVHND